MPLGHENPYSPMGGIEQFTKFASGMNRATGWRRIAGRLLALVILLPVIAAIILAIAHYVCPARFPSRTAPSHSSAAMRPLTT
jgi:hypothetical protein